MLKWGQHLLEFEAKLEDGTYGFRLVQYARLFWLERLDLPDWLAYFDDGINQLQKIPRLIGQSEVESPGSEANQNPKTLTRFLMG